MKSDSEPGWYLFHCAVCCETLGVLPRVYWEHKDRKTMPAFASHTECMAGLGPLERMVVVSEARSMSTFYRDAQRN